MHLGRFRIHRLSSHRSPMPVTVGGEEMMADVHTMEMELTSEDSTHGTVTLRFFKAADRDQAQDFGEGSVVVLSMDHVASEA